MRTLQGKTLFITGGSRGIGRAIALRAATDGANVVIVAKTADPHAKLPGTIHTVAKEINDAGGQALPLAVPGPNTRYADEAIRPNVLGQCSRGVCGHAGRLPVPRTCNKPSCTDALSSFESASCVVRRSLRLHDIQVWDEHVCLRYGGRVSVQRHCGQCTLTAHND
jgi:hypothetical protein